jgi:hypothetical protein
MPSPYTGDASSLETKLERHLSRMQFPLSSGTRADLYACVCEYVDAAKALGWPPERVLIDVKRIARDAGLRMTRNALRCGYRPTGVDLLLGDMVGWCIKRYYAGAETRRRY